MSDIPEVEDTFGGLFVVSDFDGTLSLPDLAVVFLVVKCLVLLPLATGVVVVFVCAVVLVLFVLGVVGACVGVLESKFERENKKRKAYTCQCDHIIVRKSF